MKNTRMPLVAGLVCSLALLLCLPAQAQDAKVSREREALRRAQTALRAATEKQDAMQAGQAKLAQDKEQLEKDLSALRGQSQGSAARLKAAEQRVEALQAELQAAGQSRQDLEAASRQREKTLQDQLLAQRRLNAEQVQTGRALTALLERSTQALADAEAKNRQLQALGHELVKRTLTRTPFENATIGDPVLGLTDVRLENQAEELRSRLAELRVP